MDDPEVLTGVTADLSGRSLEEVWLGIQRCKGFADDPRGGSNCDVAPGGLTGLLKGQGGSDHDYCVTASGLLRGATTLALPAGTLSLTSLLQDLAAELDAPPAGPRDEAPVNAQPSGPAGYDVTAGEAVATMPQSHTDHGRGSASLKPDGAPAAQQLMDDSDPGAAARTGLHAQDAMPVIAEDAAGYSCSAAQHGHQDWTHCP